jgi:small conductance mechanosensitive channel
VTLRITRLRDGDGVVWYMRNGEILRLGNRSQGWSVAVVDVQVAYTEDVARVTAILGAASEPLTTEEPWKDLLLDAPSVTGIESMAQGLVTVRVTAKVRANERDTVQRELRTRIKSALDAHNIRMPVPGPYPGSLPGSTG